MATTAMDLDLDSGANGTSLNITRAAQSSTSPLGDVIANFRPTKVCLRTLCLHMIA